MLERMENSTVSNCVSFYIFQSSGEEVHRSSVNSDAPDPEREPAEILQI